MDLSIRPYSPEWPRAFEEEQARVAAAVPAHAAVGMRIEHIGSTSVPGLSAKAYIDIAVHIPIPAEGEGAGEGEPLQEFKRGMMIGLGYELASPMGAWYIRHCNLADGAGFIIHLLPNTWEVASDSQHLLIRTFERALLFRDFLRSNPIECAQYEAAKRAAAEKSRGSFLLYTAEKRQTMSSIMQRAMGNSLSDKRWDFHRLCDGCHFQTIFSGGGCPYTNDPHHVHDRAELMADAISLALSSGKRRIAGELLAEAALLGHGTVAVPHMYCCNEITVALVKGRPEDLMLLLEYLDTTPPGGYPWGNPREGGVPLHDWTGRWQTGMAVPLHDQRFPYDSVPGEPYHVAGAVRFPSLNNGENKDSFLVIMRAWHGVGPAREMLELGFEMSDPPRSHGALPRGRRRGVCHGAV